MNAHWKPGDSIDLWHIVGDDTRREDQCMQAIVEDRARIALWCEHNSDGSPALQKLAALLRGNT